MEKTKNTERVFMIINSVIASKNGISFTALQQATNLPKSSLHSLLKELCGIDILKYTTTNKLYNVGTSFISLSAICISSINLLGEINSLTMSVAIKLEETVHAGILRNTDVVYIAKQDSASKISIVSSLGITMPAHCTGVGKALLMYKKPDELRVLYDGQQLMKLTENTITDLENLIEEIQYYTNCGYALERGESSPLAGCVAMPIRHNGSIIASISVTIPLLKMTSNYIENIVCVLKDEVDELERRVNIQ